MIKNKLTQKQQKFVIYYLELGNGVQAALKAYNTRDYSTAHSIASENLQKPTIRQAIEAIMNSYDFNNTYLLKIHRGLLEDKNPMVVAKALDMAYKVKGIYELAKAQKKNESEISKLSDQELEDKINTLVVEMAIQIISDKTLLPIILEEARKKKLTQTHSVATISTVRNNKYNAQV